MGNNLVLVGFGALVNGIIVVTGVCSVAVAHPVKTNVSNNILLSLFGLNFSMRFIPLSHCPLIIISTQPSIYSFIHSDLVVAAWVALFISHLLNTHPKNISANSSV